MKLDVIDQKNNKVDTLEVSEKVFNTRWNPDLVHQALTIQMANRREVLAHAKGRGEVSGGGKKPWKQKGTGRARHGSTRSPLWAHGGVAHGPKKERNFTKSINKKMNRLALASALSQKIKDKEIRVIDTLELGETAPKTKIVSNIVRALHGAGKAASMLIIAHSQNKKINTAASNIAKIHTISAHSLNIYDVMRSKNIIIEKTAIKEIEEHYKI